MDRDGSWKYYLLAFMVLYLLVKLKKHSVDWPSPFEILLLPFLVFLVVFASFAIYILLGFLFNTVIDTIAEFLVKVLEVIFGILKRIIRILLDIWKWFWS
ncbi:hypothetical protein [Thermocrinis minervae]|uniref:Uncharacterized protein n=1 Tax=Thermocrinis minervae TaxID=381751 RepID=A0A1M6TLT3_9AQUI|nr:hypothetical protein [Thermocrinis minervae]SHK57894.1 hypothetical protein SAMN05444391_1516 [Thermocrinis minervae]